VNRKERRAQGKAQPASALFDAAVQYHGQGRLAEAAQLYRRVLALQPLHADSLHRLGVLAYQQGRLAEAAQMLQAAIARNAKAASYHSHLGLVLAAMGRLEEAENSCRTATQLQPGQPDLHNNLGAMLMHLGKRQEAAASFQAAIACGPGLAEPHENLGQVLLQLGQYAGAEQCFRALISLAPSLAQGHDGLACALLAQGNAQGALPAILRSLALEETAERRKIFVQCVKDTDFAPEAGTLRPYLLRALNEGWDRPDDLARAAAALITPDPDNAILAALSKDELLLALLARTANQDLTLERLLTVARRTLLENGDAQAGPLEFAAALAMQCFINEYVFPQDDEEELLAGQLRDRLAGALESGAVLAPQSIAILAAYLPLGSVPGAQALLARSWPPCMDQLLTQQLREPQEEAELRKSIPRLTAISDRVSQSVQAQYEENPYPRWVQAGTCGAAEDLATYLRRKFPFADVRGSGEGIDILIAGCGTGRNAIETAQRFKGANSLAVDLSLNSLGYAVRKTPPGLAVTYAQADLLELGSIGRRFDLIEAVGVLHHLADPFAGWRMLLSLLKPGGVMLVGFYSASARRNLPDRSVLPQSSSAQAIRQARQHLIGQYPVLAEHPDFFTISSCRDLLFHVQEHHVPLAAIGEFLAAGDLTLLGFDVEDAVLAAYRQRFPDDPGAVDLDHWQVFERENPDIFSGMYQFWLQKKI